MWRESVKMSWNNIVHNKMRSFLTILGIVIGVGSIIALITIVQGATNEVTTQVASFGADKITVQSRGTPLKQGLLDSDLQKLEGVDHVAGVSPTISGATTVVYDKIAKEKVLVSGKNQTYFTKNDDLVSSGRALNILDMESQNKVCLIGTDLKKALFFGEDPIGKKMLIGGVTYTIVGTLKESDGFSASSTNDSVIIPYTTAMRFLGTRYISSVDVYMADSKYSASISQDVQQVLRQAFNYNDDAFSVINMQDILSTIEDMTAMLSMMLAGIASISLLVGGIGIMNMMLVSVSERTTEIGLRKALGAEPRRIQQQFLIEAVFLSLFGGLVGLVFGMAVAGVVCVLIDVPFAVTGFTILLALGFSGAVGILFGLAPARKASRLNPIDALRSV